VLEDGNKDLIKSLDGNESSPQLMLIRILRESARI